jgi:hypothetical protein
LRSKTLLAQRLNKHNRVPRKEAKRTGRIENRRQ